MIDDVGSRKQDDEEIDLAEAIRNDSSGVYGQIIEMGSEVDDYLAEDRFDAVKQTIDSLVGVLNGSDTEQIVELGHLQATSVAGRPVSEEIPVAVEIPRLTVEDLPAVAQLDEDEDYDEFIESMRERRSRCADHIRRLFDSAATLWERATDHGEAGRIGLVEETVRSFDDLAVEFGSAYSLWELCLVDLYNESPSHLSHAGDMITLTEEWLASQRSHQDPGRG